MADTKISGLSAVTDVLATDEFVLARSGTTKKITGANLEAEIGASPVGAWSLLYDNTLGSNTQVFDTNDQIGSLAGFTHLEIVWMLRTTDANNTVRMRFNNDSGNNYAYQLSYAAGTRTESSVSGQSSIGVGLCSASTLPTDMFNTGMIRVGFYGSAKLKSSVASNGAVVPGFGSGNQYSVHSTGEWNSTAAITRVQLRADTLFATGSAVQVYGIT